MKYILLILLILSIGCKEEFFLESNSYDPIIVIDGMITNEPGPYTIKISESAPINNKLKNYPLEDCIVTVFDNENNSEVLSEIESGLYSTSLNGIRGEVGKSYRIEVITPNKKEYYTDLQEIKEPVGIDSVYAKLTSINHDITPDGLPGYQFFVDTETCSSLENYFLWKSTETYEYTVDFELFDIIFGVSSLDTNAQIRDTIVHDYKQNLFRCWNTQNVNYIFTGKTINLNTPKIIGQPMQFVGTDSKRLQVRYSLNIEQYTVNKEAYYFCQKVEEQSANDNFLIASQPYNIAGNIKNSNNPDEIVFGRFTAASVSQKRIYVNRPEVKFYYDDCTLQTDDDIITDIISNGKPPFYLVEFNNSYGFGILSYEFCVNCTLDQGNNLMPDFWISK